MSEELDLAVKKADEAIAEFEEHPDDDTARYADYHLTRLRLLLGQRFSDLHYYVSRHADIIHYIENQKRK